MGPRVLDSRLAGPTNHHVDEATSCTRNFRPAGSTPVPHPQSLGLHLQESLELLDLLEAACPYPDVGRFLVSGSQYGLYVRLHISESNGPRGKLKLELQTPSSGRRSRGTNKFVQRTYQAKPGGRSRRNTDQNKGIYRQAAHFELRPLLQFSGLLAIIHT